MRVEKLYLIEKFMNLKNTIMKGILCEMLLILKMLNFKLQ